MLTIPTALWPHLLSQRFRPVEVYEIEAFAGRAALYLASHDLTWNSQAYTGLAVERTKIKYALEFKVPDCEITFSNVTNALRSALTPIDTLTGARLTVRLLMRDSSDALLTDSLVLFKGRIEPPNNISENSFRASVIGLIDGAGLEIPGRRFGVVCPWDFANGGSFDGGGHCAYQSSTQANGAGSASVTLIVDAASTFENYDVIQIGGGAAVTILSGAGSTTLGLSEARTWADNALVRYSDCSRFRDACEKRGQLYRMGGFPGIAQTARLKHSSSRRGGKGQEIVPTPQRRIGKLSDQNSILADTTTTLPVIIGRLRVEPALIETIRDTIDDREYRVNVYGVCEGPIDSIVRCVTGSVGSALIDVVEGSVKTYGVYYRLGGVGVNDIETLAEYAADAATRIRAQNIDYRSPAGIANSETVYIIFIRKAEVDMELFPKFEVELKALLLQAYAADGSASGSPAWSSSPIWACIALTASDRFGLRAPLEDIDAGASKPDADYCFEQIQGSEAVTKVVRAQASASARCIVRSTEGFIPGKRVDVDGVANTCEDVVSDNELTLGTAVTQALDDAVSQRPSRFEAHVEMNESRSAMDWLRRILACCRGYVTYDAGKVQFRVERDTVKDRVTEGSFEVWPPTGWTLNTGGATITQDAAIAPTGSFSAKIARTDGSTFSGLTFAPVLEPGRWYRLVVWHKADALGIGNALRVFLKNTTQTKYLDPDGVTWNTATTDAIVGIGATTAAAYEITFKVREDFAATDTYQLGLTPYFTTGHSVWYDAVLFRGPYAGDFREFTGAQIMGWKDGSFAWSVDKKDRETNRVLLQLQNRSGAMGRDEIAVNDYVHQRTHAVKTLHIDGDALDGRDQGYRIAKFHLDKKRTLGPGCTFLGSPAALALQPGDIIPVSHTIPGWTCKEQRVIGIEILGLGDPDEHFVEVRTEDYQESIYSDVGPPQSSVPSSDTAITVIPSIMRNSGGILDLVWTQSAAFAPNEYFTIHKSATTGFDPNLSNEIGRTTGLSFTYTAREDELDVLAYYRVVAHGPLHDILSDEFAATIFSAAAIIPPGTGYSNDFQFPATIVTPKDSGDGAYVNESGASATVAKVTDGSDATYLKGIATMTDGDPDDSGDSIEFHSFGSGTHTGRPYVRANRESGSGFARHALYYTLDRTAGTPTWILWQSFTRSAASDAFGPELSGVDYAKFSIKAKTFWNQATLEITATVTGKVFAVAFDEKA